MKFEAILLSCAMVLPARGFTTTTTTAPSFGVVRQSKTCRFYQDNLDASEVAAVKESSAMTTSSSSYDDAVYWSPGEAAAFVHFHLDEPEEAGKQMAPLVENWRGAELADFLTRLYLGRGVRDGFKVAIENSYVRDPRWKGLSGSQGWNALHDLLGHALPDEALEPIELAKFAELFLLKEHAWPSQDSLRQVEKDSFAGQGHSGAFGTLLGNIRQERLGTFSLPEIIQMLNMNKGEDVSKAPLMLTNFYANLGVHVTSTEKIVIVRGLAQGGWHPAHIAKFVSTMEELTPLPVLYQDDLDDEEEFHQHGVKEIVAMRDGDDDIDFDDEFDIEMEVVMKTKKKSSDADDL